MLQTGPLFDQKSYWASVCLQINIETRVLFSGSISFCAEITLATTCSLPNEDLLLQVSSSDHHNTIWDINNLGLLKWSISQTRFCHCGHLQFPTAQRPSVAALSLPLLFSPASDNWFVLISWTSVPDDSSSCSESGSEETLFITFPAL